MWMTLENFCIWKAFPPAGIEGYIWEQDILQAFGWDHEYMSIAFYVGFAFPVFVCMNERR